MDSQRWNEILLRIVPQDATDIDDITGPFDSCRAAAEGTDIFPELASVLMPQCRMKRRDAVCIGLRAKDVLSDAADRAVRLAAFAIERDSEVVVFAHSDASGLERFGFRVERVAGDTEAARSACEDQLRRFWNIDLVL
jgi:hypothetical protein